MSGHRLVRAARGWRVAGQTLILAIIILLLLVLVGALFVLSLAGNLNVSRRGGETVKARALADAGIDYASDQMLASPLGADWRPPGGAPPGDQTYWDDYEILRGWDRAGFTKYPDPRPDIEAPAEPPLGEEGYFLLKVEYLWNPAQDPQAPALKITSIGRSFEEPRVYQTRIVYKPIALTRYLWFVTNRGRSAQPAVIGLPWLDMNEDGQEQANEWLDYGISGGVRVNGDLLWTGSVRVLLDPVLRQRVEVAGQILHDPANADVRVSLDGGASSVPVSPSADPQFNALQGRYRDDLARLVGDPDRYTPRLEAPSLGLDVRDPATGRSRWEQLTRYSGQVLGASLTTGEYGFGEGLWIGNQQPTQRQDLELARNEWMGEDVSAVPGGWQGLRYVPPGVEIVLYPYDVDETAWQNAAQYPSNYSDDPQVPDLMVRRDPNWGDSLWEFAPDGTPLLINGNPTPTQFLFFDYPENGVIYAEGNVRIHGTLAPGYSLTVVSGGSIYIEGNLLRPSDAGLAQAGDVNDGRIALLARDHVVLNPTAFFLGGPGLAFQPDTSDLDGPRHYLLTPGQTAFLTFSFGAPPGANLGLVVKHAASDATLPTFMDLRMFRGDPNRPWVLAPQNSGIPYQPGLERYGFQLSQPYPSYQGGYLPDLFGTGSNYDTSLAEAFDPTPGLEHAFWFTNLATGDPASQGDYWLSNAKLVGPDGAPGLDIVVSALMMAERGTFFIIPGDWFDPTITAGDDPATQVRYRRYNYRITVNGALVIDETASPTDVAEWANKWSYPDGMQWGSVRYRYDPGLLLPRAPNDDRLRLPHLPVGPEVVDAGMGG